MKLPTSMINRFFIVMKKVEPFSRVLATVTNPNQRSRHIEETELLDLN
jgi:hypothetical protein